MTSSIIELDRPITTSGPNRRGPRRRRWLIALAVSAGVLGTTVATGTAFVLTHAGNEPMTSGVHTVKVYTVVDDVSTVVAPEDRPGVIGRFIGMCDADSYYMEVNGGGLCMVLNGSLGTVKATGTAHGAVLSAGDAAKVRDIVRRDDRGASEKSTRVVLEYDEGWAGLVKVSDLSAGGPVTAGIIN
jgi:hypothetical protein